MALSAPKPKRPPDQSPTQYATTADGCVLAYRVWKPSAIDGSPGIPLILVQVRYKVWKDHCSPLWADSNGTTAKGWMGVKEDWAGLDRALCKRIRAPVVVFDNRGSGESDVPDTPYSIGLFASDLNTVAEASLGNTAYDVLGISMGGCIALMAALSGSTRIRRIVLGCSTPGGPETRLGKDLVASFNMVQMANSMSPREFTTNMQYRNLPAWWIEQHPDIFEQYISDLLRHRRPLQGIIKQMQALSRFNLSKLISNITVPTLIVHGDEDEMVPIESGRLLMKKIPTASGCELRGASHFFWITHLHDTVRAVAEFLNSQNGSINSILISDNSAGLVPASTNSYQRAKL